MKASMRDTLEAFVRRRMPPGTPVTADAIVFSLIMGGAFVRSLFFFMDYQNAYTSLFEELISGEMVLRDGAVMSPFPVLMDGVLAGFTFAAVLMLVYVFRNLLTFYQGSRSIYLMRRLPDAWELPRRTLFLPLCGALTAILFSLLLYGIFYAVYMCVTPSACLTSITEGIAFGAWFGF